MVKYSRKFQKRRTALKRNLRKSKFPRRKMGNSKLFATKDLVSYMAGPRKLPFPERYRTKLHMEVDGFWLPAVLANNYAQAGPPVNQYFTVLGNGVITPFAANSTSAIAATLMTLNNQGLHPIATSNPIGHNLLQTIYNGYRVFSSKIKVTAIPQSIVDPINLVIIPSFNQGSLLLTPNNPTQDVAYLAQYPFAKSKTIQCNSGNYVLSSSISTHKLLGITKQALLNDLSGNYTVRDGANGNPGSVYNWYIAWQTEDNAAPAGNIGFKVEITYYIEYFNTTAVLLTS